MKKPKKKYSIIIVWDIWNIEFKDEGDPCCQLIWKYLVNLKLDYNRADTQVWSQPSLFAKPIWNVKNVMIIMGR